MLQPVEGGVVMERHQLGGGRTRTRGQRGKDIVGIVRCRHCKYCTQHGKSLEEATECSERGASGIYGQTGRSVA